MASKTHGSVRVRVRCLYDTFMIRRRRAPHHAVAATCRDILDHGPRHGPARGRKIYDVASPSRNVESRRVGGAATGPQRHRALHNTTFLRKAPRSSYDQSSPNTRPASPRTNLLDPAPLRLVPSGGTSDPDLDHASPIVFLPSGQLSRRTRP